MCRAAEPASLHKDRAVMNRILPEAVWATSTVAIATRFERESDGTAAVVMAVINRERVRTLALGIFLLVRRNDVLKARDTSLLLNNPLGGVVQLVRVLTTDDPGCAAFENF